MKNYIIIPILLGLYALSSGLMTPFTGNWLVGSWKNEQSIALFTKSYFSITHFDKEKKIFSKTIGGTYKPRGEEMELSIEFSYPDTTQVGQLLKSSLSQKGNTLTLEVLGEKMTWEKEAKNGDTPLSNLWQITGREQKDGSMGEMKKGARKTVKIMTHNRFQWIALNTETKVFSGTGGGTFTLIDGKYTETLDFFSRDNTRVGMSLSFDAKVEGKKWQHSGKSSKGDKVNEIWEGQE